MDKEVLCELCNTPMKKIGPFASVKPEGQPARKFDGKLQFQCCTEECSAYQNIVEIEIGDLEDYFEKMQKLCKCEHTRSMHNHFFSRIEEGQPIQPARRDVECKANNCDCKKFVLQEV